MDSGRYLSPRLLQIAGLVLLVGSVVFWAVTGRQSALMVGASISLISLGAWSGIRVYLDRPADPHEPEAPFPPLPGGAAEKKDG